MFGNIYNIENCTNCNGPGTRFAVILQGCPMRCMYCNNPESWNFNVNKKMSCDEILSQYDNVKDLLKNGGLTVSGGEPLSQVDFVSELFKKAKAKNINTALDTSGAMFNKNATSKIDELLNYTDLVLLDIKHINPVEHKKLTGFELLPILEFAKYLSDKEIPVWIRHVVIPRVNSSQNHLVKLGEFLSTLNNIQALDVLPFVNTAASKYEELKIPYYLKDIPSMAAQDVQNAREIILNSMRKARLSSR